jgi:hypothetical protein
MRCSSMDMPLADFTSATLKWASGMMIVTSVLEGFLTFVLHYSVWLQGTKGVAERIDPVRFGNVCRMYAFFLCALHCH